MQKYVQIAERTEDKEYLLGIFELEARDAAIT